MLATNKKKFCIQILIRAEYTSQTCQRQRIVHNLLIFQFFSKIFEKTITNPTMTYLSKFHAILQSYETIRTFLSFLGHFWLCALFRFYFWLCP